MVKISVYQERTDSEKIGLLTKSINLAVEKERNRYLAEYGLTAVQTDVLHYVNMAQSRGIEVNQVDIEQELHLSNPTVTGILKRLEAKGFVVKKESLRDHRYKSVCMTDQAKTVHQRSLNNKHRVDEALLKGLTREQCIAVIAALETMLENMQELNSKTFDD